MMELFQYDFFINAFYAVILTSIICGIAGSLIVVNQMVFLAGAVAHAAYGGVGLAFFLDMPVIPTTFAFSSITSAFLGFYTYNKNTRLDSLIGIFWAIGMALGIILIDLTPGYSGNLISYLFGGLFAVSNMDIFQMAVLVVLLLSFIGLSYNKIVLFSFDREFAYVKGINVMFYHIALIVIFSMSIVLLIKTVGLILVIAMLTIPQHLSEKKSSSLAWMMLLSSLYAMFFGISGLFLSYYFNITSGASIIGFGAFYYILEKIFLRIKKYANMQRIIIQ